MVFLCCASQASSGDSALSFVRAAVVVVLSSSLAQRLELSAGVPLVESWRKDMLSVAQRRATVAESALRHRLASADIDVDGVTSLPPFSHRCSSSDVVPIMSSDVLREEFEVQQLKFCMVIEIFSLECLHPGPRVHLPN